MENTFKERREKNYIKMRRIRDITMAALILVIGILALFADYFGLVLTIDNTIRYLFGALCILYGGFRLYRGIKQDY